jgi:hypothetical protein
MDMVVGKGLRMIFTRDDFKALVGSTPQDVIAAVGPTELRDAAAGRTTWHYLNKTKDPATGKIDVVAKVVFDKGVVVEVNFLAADEGSKAK